MKGLAAKENEINMFVKYLIEKYLHYNNFMFA